MIFEHLVRKQNKNNVQEFLEMFKCIFFFFMTGSDIIPVYGMLSI